MGRYCRGVQAIVYVVDAADHDAVQVGLRHQQRQWQQQQQRWQQFGVAAARFVLMGRYCRGVQVIAYVVDVAECSWEVVSTEAAARAKWRHHGI
jgi:hypothetical protein